MNAATSNFTRPVSATPLYICGDCGGSFEGMSYCPNHTCPSNSGQEIGFVGYCGWTDDEAHYLIGTTGEFTVYVRSPLGDDGWDWSELHTPVPFGDDAWLTLPKTAIFPTTGAWLIVNDDAALERVMEGFSYRDT